jgi:hypothetical protein
LTPTSPDVAARLASIQSDMEKMRQVMATGTNIRVEGSYGRATSTGIELLDLFDRPLAFAYESMPMIIREPENGLKPLCENSWDQRTADKEQNVMTETKPEHPEGSTTLNSGWGGNSGGPLMVPGNLHVVLKPIASGADTESVKKLIQHALRGRVYAFGGWGGSSGGTLAVPGELFVEIRTGEDPTSARMEVEGVLSGFAERVQVIR